VYQRIINDLKILLTALPRKLSMFKFVVKAGLVAGNFALLAGFAVTAHAAPAIMSSEWGSAVCDTWDQDPVLTDELASSDWVDNNAGRPSRVMHVYRSDCGDEPTAEIRIAPVDGKAQCVYRGAVETTALKKSGLPDACPGLAT
jgi:hypothetical protein